MIVFAVTDISVLVPFAIFGTVAVVSWMILEFVAASKPRAEERLDEFTNPCLRKRANEAKTGDAMARVLEKATPAMAKPLQPKTHAEQSKLRERLSHAGFRGDGAVSFLLGMKCLGIVLGVLIGGGMSLFMYGFQQDALVRTVIATGVLFYLPEMVLWFITSKRKQSVFLGLPDALDLMVVCVEAGLGLDQAMRKVAEEMKKSHRTVAYEFSLCNLQLQMGCGRNDVLHELGQRNGVDDLRALASILIQADKFGSSIAQALRVQSESMRTRRRQIAEEKAAKTAVQLIFPLVLFIFPGIFVVLVGPAAITMINEMFPMMSGG